MLGADPNAAQAADAQLFAAAALATMEACATGQRPDRCLDADTFQQNLNRIALSEPTPDARALQVLAAGLTQNVFGSCFTGGGAPNNQFCAQPEAVISAMRPHVLANPEVGVTVLVNVMDTWLRSGNDFDLGRATGDSDDMFARAIDAIAINMPRITDPVTRARALIFLGDLANQPSLFETARIASRALATIADQQARQAAQKKQQEQQQQLNQLKVSSDLSRLRTQKILLVVAGIAVLGGSALLTWRLTRRKITIPAPAFGQLLTARKPAKKSRRRRRS
jgi:hypothetical protein